MSIDPNIMAALIGALVGFGGSAIFTLWRDARREARECRLVATALLSEVLILTSFLPEINAALAAAKRETLQGLRSRLPPPPTVYPALADRLPLLGSTAARHVVECYGGMAWLEMQLSASAGDAALAATVSRGVMACACDAITSLDAIAKIANNAEHQSRVADLLRGLRKPVPRPAAVRPATP